MKLNAINTGTVAALLLASPLVFGHAGEGQYESEGSGYLSAGGFVVKSGTGDCVGTGDLNDDNRINGCEGIEDAPEPEAETAATTEEPAPAPVPTIVPVSKTIRADFESGSAVPTAEGEAEISRLISELSQMQGIDSIAIGGHSDSRGSEAFNQQLSEQRANTVKDRLQAAFPEATITATGYGESNPIESNDTAAGRAANRRVEVVVNARQNSQ